MLRIKSDSAANKLVSTESINKIGGHKIIIEANSKESKIGFLFQELNWLLPS